jgi:RND family efflux transporter MFP subunit
MAHHVHTLPPHFIVPRAALSLPCAVLALAACAALLVGCERGEAASARDNGASTETVRVKTVAAERRELPDMLELSATLQPDEESKVTPLVPGRVSRVFVERGAKVNEGDLLVRLRNVDYRTAADSANAALQQARARLGISGDQEASFDPAQSADVRAADANRKLTEDAAARAEKLSGSGAMSTAEVESARQRAAAAREQYEATLNATRGSWLALKNAKLSLEQAQRNVTDSTVRAPFGGEVAERKVSVGEYVTPQQPVVTLVRIDPLRLELDFPQAEIGRVHAGQSVEVRVDAYPERVFMGTLRYVGVAVAKQSRALTVEAVVQNHDGALRPGLFVKARILLGGQREIVAVPKTAVLEVGGTRRAYVVVEHHLEERVLAVIGSEGDVLLVNEGLKAAERVAIGQLDHLSDGQEVRD